MMLFLVTHIEASAFHDCSSLEAVTFPEGFKSIGPSAFQNCSALASITFLGKIDSISSSAFYNCKKLSFKTQAGLRKLGYKGDF